MKTIEMKAYQLYGITIAAKIFFQKCKFKDEIIFTEKLKSWLEEIEYDDEEEITIQIQED